MPRKKIPEPLRMALTTEQCIEQFTLYAESNQNLGNKDMAKIFNFCAEFLALNHEDFYNKFRGLDSLINPIEFDAEE